MANNIPLSIEGLWSTDNGDQLLDNDFADQMLTDLEGQHWWRGTGPYEAAPGPPKVGLFTEPH